jgi:HAD superfamily hydrolase (TIGR01549 family)
MTTTPTSSPKSFQAVFFDSGNTLYRKINPALEPPGLPTPESVSADRLKRISALLYAHGAQITPQALLDALTECEKSTPADLGPRFNHDHLMVALLKSLNLSLGPQTGPELAALLSHAYAGPRYRHWLYPGTHEMLQTLTARGLYLGVIANTAWTGHCMDRAFAGVGLLPFFNLRIYSSDHGIAKPDPAIFKLTQKNAGLTDPSRILYVGDRAEKDVAGAHAAGWRAALRVPSHGKAASKAELEFTSWHELLNFILKP